MNVCKKKKKNLGNASGICWDNWTNLWLPDGPNNVTIPLKYVKISCVLCWLRWRFLLEDLIKYSNESRNIADPRPIISSHSGEIGTWPVIPNRYTYSCKLLVLIDFILPSLFIYRSCVAISNDYVRSFKLIKGIITVMLTPTLMP